MHPASRIARNTAWFTVGSVLQKLISFAYFTVIAMAFGVSGTSRYFFALAFTALFAVAADWGLAPVLTREVARDRTRGLALMVPAFLLKAGFACLTAIAVTGVAAAEGYAPDARRMIAVATLVMVLDSAHLGIYALLRGIERVHYEAIGMVAGQIALTTSGIAILVTLAGLRMDLGGAPPIRAAHDIAGVWLLAPYVAASVVNVGIALVGGFRERVLRWTHTGQLREALRLLLRTATPFAITGLLARVYTYSDTFLLSVLLPPPRSVIEIGFYSTPFKIAFAFQFIPLAFVGAWYPAVSAVARRSPEQLRALLAQALRALWIVALPLAFGIGILAGDVIPWLYGPAFQSSVVPLIILAATLPFVFANFPCGYLLNACDRQVMNTKLLAVATAVNIAANVVLIPPLGAVGAAASAGIGTVTLFALNLVAVRGLVRYDLRALLGPFLRTTAACLAMAAVVLALRSLPMGVRGIAGVCTYAGAALAFGAVRGDDLRTLRGFFARTAVVAPSNGV